MTTLLQTLQTCSRALGRRFAGPSLVCSLARTLLYLTLTFLNYFPLLPLFPSCVPRQVIFVLVLIRQCWVFVCKLQKRAKVANDEFKKIKLKQLFKIRGRLLKKEGMDALHLSLIHI